MRVLIIEPRLEHRGRGNLTTTRRWAEGLTARGIDVVTAASQNAEELEGQSFDLVHAHHAGRSGPAGLRLARRHRMPLVVSSGGTDIRGPRAFTPEVKDVLRHADLVISPFNSDAECIAGALGAPIPFAVVPRGIPAGAAPTPPEDPRADRWLFSGGLRDVKDPLLAVRIAEAARRAGFDVALDLYGPAIDESLLPVLENTLASSPDRYRGEAPPDTMSDIYESHDLLINSSLSEGASNSILEAWRSGLVVLARRVPGNIEMLSGAPSEIAFLFDEGNLLDPPMRAWLAAAARNRRANARRAWEHVRTHHSEKLEIDALLTGYRRATSRGRSESGPRGA